jgi:endonuclease YncB( thermonuclease family)
MPIRAHTGRPRDRTAAAAPGGRQNRAQAGGLRLPSWGTEGTISCTYGRLCAVLTADGRDVGELLISEGLAHEYICSENRCPRRQPCRALRPS